MKRIKIKILTFLFIAVILLAGSYALVNSVKRLPQTAPAPMAVAPAVYPHASIVIAGETFDARVANTEALKERGLSGSLGLGIHEAMLFPYDKPSYPAFWMKDMLYSIDMLWVDASGTVVSFEKSVAPSTFPNTFSPKALSSAVVELPAGTLERLQVKEGDKVLISY